MDDERRIRALERTVKNFRIAGEGLIGGFPPSSLRTDKSYTAHERVSDLESRFKNFRLQGTEGVQVAGSLKQGYAVNAIGGTVAAGDGGGGPTPVSGCTDPTATNYNPAATVDDGSCTYASGTEVVTELDSSVPGTLVVTTDGTGWTLI